MVTATDTLRYKFLVEQLAERRERSAKEWVLHEISDNVGDTKADAVDDLRDQLRALPVRPILLRGLRGGDLDFPATLEVNEVMKSDLTRIQNLLSILFRCDDTTMLYGNSQELSLLLRLLVALGVNIGVAITCYDDCYPNRHTSGLSAMCTSIAILAAGRRLGLDFKTWSLKRRDGVTFQRTSFSVVLLRPIMHEMLLRDYATRVGYMAGEAGLLYAQDGVISALRPDCFQYAMRPYLADDASPHRWPVTITENNPNARRDAYRAGVPLLVSDCLRGVAPVVAIVLGYIWMPLR